MTNRSHRVSWREAVLLLLPILPLTPGPALAAPGADRWAAMCAAHDLHALTLIEDHGLVGETEVEALEDAAALLLEARGACRTGDGVRGLALYESIDLDPVRLSPLHRILMR